MRTDILERKDEILDWIRENESKAYICKQLKCKPETLESYLKKMEIQYLGNQGLRGKKTDLKYKTAEEYVQGNYVKSHTLKLKLFRDGIKERRCEKCDLTEWLGKPAPLELDHIDGNHYNNEFENLRILCPNCHAIQETNSGKNGGKYMRE